MRTGLLAGLAAIVVTAAVASAAPDGAVDRERLKKTALLPSVGPKGWYYVLTTDGRVLAGGEEPENLDVAALRARIAGDDSDARRWMDVAAACRRAHDDAQAKQCVASAVAILRTQTAAHPDDGVALASLGLALAAAGDGEGADAAIRGAEGAASGAWAGLAASADRVVMQALGRAAGRRFATLDDARDWLAANEEKAKGLDGALLAAAAGRYDDAVAGVEKSGATGSASASVYVRRMTLRAILRATSHDLEEHAERHRLAADQGKARAALAQDPYALTLTALEHAMSEEAAEDGSTHVQAFDDLPDAARANVTADLARLGKLAAAADAATAARALQGIACVQWFSMHNAAAAESVLRRSVAKDPGLQSSWNALVYVMGQAGRWDDLAKLCDEWIKSGETARNRMIRAKALALAGHADEAEKEWRAAQALEPDGIEPNLGVAVLVLRRAKDESDVTEARRFLDMAAAAAAAPGAEPAPACSAACAIADAVARGLSGDLDGAEKSARRAGEVIGNPSLAKEILAALNR